MTSAPAVCRIAAAAIAAAFGSQSLASSCVADLSGDRRVDAVDLAGLLAQWGDCPPHDVCSADVTGDGRIDGTDLSAMLAAWGECPVAVPAWATLVEAQPDPAVVLAPGHRNLIRASGLAWRVRHATTQIEMVLIPAGSFGMGCQPAAALICPSAELPVHVVTLTQHFYMGRYEVTQSQWTARMGSNPSMFQGPEFPEAANHPVEMVSWQMAQQFVEGAGLRLPTEAEWEHACRAGVIPAYHGYPALPGGSGADFYLVDIAWYAANSSARTHSVGMRAANGFGLHDMSGNVAEWVHDWYAPTYFTSSPVTDPMGPAAGTTRVVRGGNWASTAVQCRSASRTHDAPSSQALTGTAGPVGHGFRVACSP